MSNYTITTNFGAKDSLPSTDAGKVIKGSEFTTEFTNIQTSIATKADTTGDTFTGVVNFSADVAVNTNTLFVDVSEGKVGIGTTSPQRELELTGTGNVYARITAPTDDDSAVLELKNTQETWQIRNEDTNDDALEFIDDTATRLTIKKDGNVGIGTNSPASRLAIHGAADVAHIVQTNTTNSQKLEIGNAYSLYTGASGSHSAIASDSVLAFATADAERMRINVSGDVLIGKTIVNHTDRGIVFREDGQVYLASDTGSTLLLNRLNDGSSVVGFLRNSVGVGSITVTGSATSYNTSSDERLKENITDSADAGSKVDAIQIRQFDWKADGLHQDYGVIAQELINVAPEAVSEGDTEEDMMGVDYSKLIPMLIKEVQSLRSRVAELENV